MTDEINDVRNRRRIPRPRREDALVCTLSFSTSSSEADILYQRARHEGLTLSAFVRKQLGLRSPDSLRTANSLNKT